MDLEQFSRQTKAAAFREAAVFVHEMIGKVFRTTKSPVAERTLRRTARRLEDKARELEQG